MFYPFRALLLASVTFVALPALAEEAKKEAAPAAAEKPAAAAAAPATAEAPKDYTILKLGSDEIKLSAVLDIWKGLFPGGNAPDFETFDENIRQNVLRGVVSERLIYQEAIKAGYDKNPEVKKRLENLEKQVVMQSYMEDKAKTLVTDDTLKKAYNTKIASLKGQEEVSARHILVASEEEAKAIADQLKKGSDFEAIAKEKSTDKGSGAKGGDLGWFTKEKMVPEFADAAFKLKKGETSPPVKSAFGWHIIKLDDRRPLKVASFDELKEELRGEVSNSSVQAYVEGLLKGAQIQYLGKDGKEKPFSRKFDQEPKTDKK